MNKIVLKFIVMGILLIFICIRDVMSDMSYHEHVVWLHNDERLSLNIYAVRVTECD